MPGVQPAFQVNLATELPDMTTTIAGYGNPAYGCPMRQPGSATVEDDIFDDDAFYRGVTEALCRQPDLALGLDASRRILASYLPADFAGIDLIEGNTGSVRTIALATAKGAQRMDRVTQVPVRPAAEVEQEQTE